MAKRFPWLVSIIFLTCISITPAFAKPSPGASPGTDAGASTDQPPRILKVAVVDDPPWSMKDEDGHWTGMTVDLLRDLAEELHYEYEFQESTLAGVQDMLQKKEVDLSGAGLAITAEREARFDFSDPYCVFNQTVAVNANQQPSMFYILRTTILSWGFLSIVLILIAITLLGALTFWLLEQRGDSEYYAQKDKHAFVRSLLWSFMVLAGRDMPASIGWAAHPPKTIWARSFGLAWMMFGILLLSLFTAGAASLLTSKQLQSIVNNQDDLRHVRCATVKGAAAQAFMDRHHIKYSTYPTPKDLLNALVERKIDAAVYASVDLSYYAKTTFSNKIAVLNFSLRHDFVAIPMPTGSPLRKPINEAILHTLESKRWQTIESKYVTD